MTGPKILSNLFFFHEFFVVARLILLAGSFILARVADLLLGARLVPLGVFHGVASFCLSRFDKFNLG